MELFLIFATFVGGYVASIFSWPWLRLKWTGLENEAQRLRQRAIDLEAKIRGL